MVVSAPRDAQTRHGSRDEDPGDDDKAILKGNDQRFKGEILTQHGVHLDL
jgi:hypothetical protein